MNTIMNLKTGNHVKIASISNTKQFILAGMESRNQGEIKNINLIELRAGVSLIFQKIDPRHFNDALFHIQGISTNVEIWISESDLNECKFHLQTSI